MQKSQSMGRLPSSSLTSMSLSRIEREARRGETSHASALCACDLQPTLFVRREKPEWQSDRATASSECLLDSCFISRSSVKFI